jgi:hypothetical protein
MFRRCGNCASFQTDPHHRVGLGRAPQGSRGDSRRVAGVVGGPAPAHIADDASVERGRSMPAVTAAASARQPRLMGSRATPLVLGSAVLLLAGIWVRLYVGLLQDGQHTLIGVAPHAHPQLWAIVLPLWAGGAAILGAILDSWRRASIGLVLLGLLPLWIVTLLSAASIGLVLLPAVVCLVLELIVLAGTRQIPA